MIFTELTQNALSLSFKAHKDQIDKSGMPYVYHPYRVAEQMNDEISICAALLHDVVEDTDITLDDLLDDGFPLEVVTVIKLLTYTKDIPYLEYIENIKANPIARAVKLADLKDNSNYERLEKVGLEDLRRNEKYRKAIRMLSD